MCKCKNVLSSGPRPCQDLSRPYPPKCIKSYFNWDHADVTELWNMGLMNCWYIQCMWPRYFGINGAKSKGSPSFPRVRRYLPGWGYWGLRHPSQKIIDTPLLHMSHDPHMNGSHLGLNRLWVRFPVSEKIMDRGCLLGRIFWDNLWPICTKPVVSRKISFSSYIYAVGKVWFPDF